MIFVTVGTQKFPFDRLFKELDRLIETGIITEHVVAQVGYNNYQSKHLETFQMLNATQMESYIRDSSIVITHAGTSSIIQCLKLRKKVIVVPRQQDLKEHVDNHQLEIAQLFEAKKLVECVYDIKDLGSKYQKALKEEYSEYEFGNDSLLNDIDNFLKQL